MDESAVKFQIRWFSPRDNQDETAKLKVWSDWELDYLRANYKSESRRQMSQVLGRSVQSISTKAFKLGISARPAPSAAKQSRSGVRTLFSQEDKAYIRNNYMHLSNEQLARTLKIPPSTLRAHLYRHGLRRNEPAVAWTPEQEAIVKAHYAEKGDVELAELLNALFPDDKRTFSKKSVWKKRSLLGLIRTPEQVKSIMQSAFNRARCDTIIQNSGSLNYSDGYVAYALATKRNPELIPEMLKHPELIELKREQLKLNRLLKSSNHDES
ncbi:hypothetical protein [Telluribacter humicola]|uniref:hypothetical protein n=1 Tax=Telluribacter humicola TaxID=1720261 RepID=UPI001A96E2CC|nr:hypothetical protein [Telluribacter humicola]